MKRFITIIPLLVMAITLTAAPLNERQARQIATSFFNGQTATRSHASATVDLVFAGDGIMADTKRTASVDSAAESLIYIYNRSDAEGFVIVAGDDATRPIVGFSTEGRFNIDNMAVATRTMLDAWCQQIAAIRAGEFTPMTKASDSPTSDIGTFICQYETADWSQDAPFNNKAPIVNDGRSLTGCVATAMSILARYHQYPEKGVGTTPEYSYNLGSSLITIPANTLGSVYDYANMPLVYPADYTAAQADAVAQLMFDMGTAAKMVYAPEGSGAEGGDELYAMCQYFGYNKEKAYIGYPYMYNASSVDNSGWVEAVAQNLKNYGPTLFNGVSSEGGHAFILDAATTEGYFGINWGWRGQNNGNYLLPSIIFYMEQEALMALEKDVAGTSSFVPTIKLSSNDTYCGLYCDKANIKQGEPFMARAAILTNASAYDFTGNIYIALCSEEGNVKQLLGNACPEGTTIAAKGKLTDYVDVQCTITVPIEVGDRLRVMYQPSGSESLYWARSDRDRWTLQDQITICATPDTISSVLATTYDKTKKMFCFTTTRVPADVTITHVESGNTIGTYTLLGCQELKFSAADMVGKGEHRFSFRCGNEPYEVIIKL